MTRPTHAITVSLVLVGLMGGTHVPLLHAQTTAGIRAGASVDPDQFYIGAHVDTPPLTDRILFRPNIEIGVGDNQTLVGLNFELAYVFPARNSWALYLGGGPALNIARVSGDTRTGGGLNALIGGMHASGLFLEAKIGGIDSPDLKLGIGYTFK